ncbi:MAG TPA: hypothetical protein VE338_07560 [Ktedonobacterales bacterium]|jgi:hypothetical protein|nr:hypothetical protein [Ktedonobacterales bacterium]
MPTPGDPLTTLTVDGTPLDLQVAAYLATDTDPTAGLVPALGQRMDDSGARSGANSIYPNYVTDGPNADRSACPTPFLLVAPGGVHGVDRMTREVRVLVEVHDTEDAGRTRWPGILRRVKWLLTRNAWRPVSDGEYTYMAGLALDDESPPGIKDERFDTVMTQLIFSVKASDLTSGGGINR